MAGQDVSSARDPQQHGGQEPGSCGTVNPGETLFNVVTSNKRKLLTRLGQNGMWSGPRVILSCGADNAPPGSSSPKRWRREGWKSVPEFLAGRQLAHHPPSSSFGARPCRRIPDPPTSSSGRSAALGYATPPASPREGPVPRVDSPTAPDTRARTPVLSRRGPRSAAAPARLSYFPPRALSSRGTGFPRSLARRSPCLASA